METTTVMEGLVTLETIIKFQAVNGYIPLTYEKVLKKNIYQEDSYRLLAVEPSPLIKKGEKILS